MGPGEVVGAATVYVTDVETALLGCPAALAGIEFVHVPTAWLSIIQVIEQDEGIGRSSALYA
jgi:hypothetical protein